MKLRAPRLLALSPALLAVACGGAIDAGSSTGQDAKTDHGSPSDTYPAYAVGMPQLLNQGGAMLGSPRVVTVTWASDPNAAAYEDFAEKLGASSYWQAAVGEYGVGPVRAASSDHVRLTTDAPATIADTDLESFIVDHVTATADWPAPDDQTVYAVFVPEATNLTSGSAGKDACNSYEGYHSEHVSDDGSTHTLFAIIDEKCHDSSQAVLDYSTSVASHEIGEASTDPHTNSDTALTGFDDEHLAWEVFNSRQDENGDACEFYDDANTENASDLPYTVQRLWSNAAGAAAHDPCVPADGSAYFNVTPLDQEDISVVVPPKRTHETATKGYRIPVGKTKTFAVGFVSDGPVDPWNIEALEGDGQSDVKSPRLEVSLDKSSGQNGEKAWVTVKVAQKGKRNGILLTIKSTRDGAAARYMPILIEAD